MAPMVFVPTNMTRKAWVIRKRAPRKSNNADKFPPKTVVSEGLIYKSEFARSCGDVESPVLTTGKHF